LFGLPAPLAARLPAPAEGGASAAISWSNFAVLQGNDDNDRATLDGEVIEARVRVENALTPRVALHAELAYRGLSGGTLDPFIDDFHEALGLPTGSRPTLPHDRLRIAYARHDTTLIDVQDDRAGFTDLPVAFGWQWLASSQGAVATWLSVKLPTGQPDQLTGSGATDLAVSIAAHRDLGSTWQLFGQANVAWLGRAEVLRRLQRDVVGSALVGVTWRASHAFELTAQVDANTAVFDAGLEAMNGEAVLATFGASYRAHGTWRFDVAISEDMQIDASPDVVFVFGVRHGF
jgi:hypothetical protein